MNKELVEIVVNKSFVELSMSEKEQLFEWCSTEEGFDQLKNVFIEVELMKNQSTENVRPSTKEKLDLLFTEKYKVGKAFRWNSSIGKVMYPFDKPFHRRPIIQIAALLLLLLLAFPVMVKTKEISNRSQLAKNEMKDGEKKISKPKKNKEQSPEESSNTPPEDQVYAADKQSSRKDLISVKARVEAVNDVPVQGGVNVSESDINYPIVSNLTENSNQVSPSVASASAADSKNQLSSFQSDGLYREVNNGVNFSKSISVTPSVLDLLSVAF